MDIVHLDKDNFDSVVASNDIVIIDFWATWCAPCVAFSDVYEQVAAAHPDILFTKVDVEAESELASDFNIRSIPHLMVLKEGIAVFSDSGAMPASGLNELISQARNVDISEVKKKIAAEDGK